MVWLKLVMMDHFGFGPLVLLDSVDQVIQLAHNEEGTLVGRQKFPHFVFHSLGAFNQVPYCIANLVLDLANVLVILTLGTLG